MANEIGEVNKMTPVYGDVNQGTVAIESSRAITEAQGKLLLAKHFPRDYTHAYAKAMEACQRKGFAEKAFYSFPRGKETVTGVTIRFAEVLAACYGNVDYGIKELSHEEGRSEMQAYAWDLETNTVSSQNFTVEHVRETKFGNNKLTSQRDIYEKTANDGARRMRSRILAILPPDMIEDCIAECKKTLSGGNSVPLADRIKQLVVYFQKKGVTQEMLEKRLNHKVEAMSPEEVADYIGIYNGINQKETTVSDWFEQPKTASQISELMKAEEEEKEKGDKK